MTEALNEFNTKAVRRKRRARVNPSILRQKFAVPKINRKAVRVRRENSADLSKHIVEFCYSYKSNMEN